MDLPFRELLLLDLAKLSQHDYDLVSSLRREINRGDRVMLSQQFEPGAEDEDDGGVVSENVWD